MPVAAVRYASPASIPADMPRYAALAYPTGARVPAEVQRLECGLYLPTEAVPADRRKVGVVPYLPGDSIPADMRRVIPVHLTGTAYAAAVLADSPVGFWRLGETSGTSAADLGSGGVAGTYSGGFTLGQTGALAAEPDGTVNGAVLLDGTSGFVDLGANTGLDITGALTVEAWVYRTATGNFHLISAVEVGTSANVAFEFRFQSGTNKIQLVHAGAAAETFTSTGDAPTNQWNHVAVTRSANAIGSTIAFYVNGAAAGTGTTTLSPTITGTKERKIGDRHSSSHIFFPGRIDEVAVYGTALPAARIAAHYAAGLGR